MPSTEGEYTLFDAGLLIGALLADDERNAEARPLVEAARRGELLACTTTGILKRSLCRIDMAAGTTAAGPGTSSTSGTDTGGTAVDDPCSHRQSTVSAPNA